MKRQDSEKVCAYGGNKAQPGQSLPASRAAMCAEARLVCRSMKQSKEFCCGEINHTYIVHWEEESSSAVHGEG